jgi:hypothetical protein
VKFVLLVGAGFSRNWGGWLASEVNGHLPTSISTRRRVNSLRLIVITVIPRHLDKPRANRGS